MQSPCITQISPAVVAASQLLSHDSELCNDDFNSVIQRCPLYPEDVTPEVLDAMKHEIDDKVLCEVMCCCSNNPCTGSEAGTNQRQGCVSSTLQAADEVLHHQSRYKPDEMGQDTTQKSDRWQTRARQEIPGYRGGQGDVRRPDVIIVKDPSKPPYQDNIDRVVEMKFKGDSLGEGQEESYETIVGDRDQLMIMVEGKNCTCADNDGELEPVPQPVAIPEEEPSVDWWAVAETAGVAVVTAVAAVATVALVAVPFDGPAGEIAAGAGTAAAATRTAAAFGRIFRAVPH